MNEVVLNGVFLYLFAEGLNLSNQFLDGEAESGREDSLEL
jgi:hypothetical protein